MELSLTFLIRLLLLVHLHSSAVFGQRDFVNPAITDPAPCRCDTVINHCEPNCCCDQDCSDGDLAVSPVCNGTRTSSTTSVSDQPILNEWNCSNDDSAAKYDYFPFVCVQLGMNEIVGKFYSTKNVTFLTSATVAKTTQGAFVAQYPTLFQSPVLSSTTTQYTARGAPVILSTAARFTLPGSLTGGSCQTAVPVLFGVNRDITCTSASVGTSFCTGVSSAASFISDGQSGSLINVTFSTKNYATPAAAVTRTRTDTYYFQDSYNDNITSIASTSGSVNDYCDGRHPLNRTQRYTFCGSSVQTGCPTGYQTFSCPLRDTLSYATIPNNFFTDVLPTVRDDPTNFLDFFNSTPTNALSCTGVFVRRVFYRFNYSSTDNTISTAEVFVLFSTTTVDPRITIEWNDLASNANSLTTIPRGYLVGEVLQFRRNQNVSDVSTLYTTSSGLCVDAVRQSLRYKQSTSSSCFIQIPRGTVQQCHDLKTNMYLYLNAFYTPATYVLAFPNANATQITLRDDTQESIDLDRIDETRPNNRLNASAISITQLGNAIYSIYDAAQPLDICFDVPSGIYIEFGFVRVSISPTISYERIVSVKYNYTFSNWKFDCTVASCDSTTTQRYPVTFQSAFIDYTNLLLYQGQATRADITSADNYIQHLLWLISPEYQGEPNNRKYTIAMILIFIAISVAVMHVLIFGIMCSF